jgi:hypothetical protein
MTAIRVPLVCFLTGLLLFASHAITSAAEADVPLAPGDDAVVVEDGAKLMVGTEVRAQLKKDDRLRVLQVRGEWLDMWAPVIIQMGRQKDYESFEAFQASVKDNPLTYEPLPEKEGAGKLTYVSETGERFEYWANSEKLPRINGKELNLNPPKTHDGPFLSMVHGEQTATIRYAGYEDVLLNFAPR